MRLLPIRLIIIALLLAGPAYSASKAPRMNVLFILIDDLGWMDLGYQGSKTYETPNIDTLAMDGVRFSQAYAAHPLCLPSRYAIQTGHNPARAPRPGHGALDKGEFTIAKAFKAAGYATFFAGKWHLSHGKKSFPEDMGYDINKGGGDAGEPGSYFFPYSVGHGLEEGVEGEYITDRLTDETIDFIRAHKDQPFFAFLSHYAVHTPHQAKPADIAYYEKKIADMKFEGSAWKDEGTGRTKLHQDNAIYAAMLHSLDQGIGRVVETLKELDLYDNTIIVFTGDNGGLSNHGYNRWGMSTSNHPLRAGKGHFYEGGNRVPAFARWPGVSKTGSESKAVLNGTDYYPALLEMCGLPLRPAAHLDGHSFAWALRGEKNPNPNRTIYWHGPRARPHSVGDRNVTAALQGNYKFIDYYDLKKTELYDLSNDLSETTDIAALNPERCETFQRKIQQWRGEVNAVDHVDLGNPYQFALRNGAFEYGNTWDWSLEVTGDAKATQELSGRNDGHNLSYHPQYNAYKLIVQQAGAPRDVAVAGSWHDCLSDDKKLVLSCYARALEADREFQLEIVFKDSAGNTTNRASKPFNLTADYTEFQLPIDAPEDYDAFQARVLAGGAKGTYYFDYVSLKKAN